MNIEFENTALEELYTKGTTQDHQYKRLSKDIIKRYVKVVNYLRIRDNAVSQILQSHDIVRLH